MPESTTTSPEVLIAGAGPTGLVLALWLTLAGVRVRIVDKLAEPGTTSRALGVQARTLEFYRQLGIDAAVIAVGVPTPAVNLWVGGARAARMPLRELGTGYSRYPYLLMYPQDAHERLLMARLAELGVAVERPVELLHFTQEAEGIRATLRHADGREEACSAAYLAACDGARSTVREALGTGFPGGTYEQLFYVADAQVSGPVANHEVHVDLERNDFLAVFPLLQAGHVRLIGTVRWDAAQMQRPLTFADVSARAIAQLQLGVDAVHWFSTYHVHHRVARHFRERRIFLLGDAAHLHSPVGAQGINTGIGDAINLGWKLAAVLQGEADATLLDSYEFERRSFARQLVATTDRLFSLVTQRGPLMGLLRRRLVPVLMPRLLALPPLRRLLFRTVSQIGIRYRGSPLSFGRAGAVRGGDRLPWLQTADGIDNHAPLAARDWQLQVYGEASTALTALCAELQLPLQVFPCSDPARVAGFETNANYLLRPDGYVALASRGEDLAALSAYVARFGLRFQRSQAPLRK